MSPVQDRCVLLSVRCTQSCFLQKTQALEVQTQSLAACESFILCSCSSLTDRITFIHCAAPECPLLQTRWEISIRRCGCIKLNQLTLATFFFIIYGTRSLICGHLKSINKRDSIGEKCPFCSVLLKLKIVSVFIHQA